MAGKKNTANRKSTPWLKFVSTRDGRKVRNLAYDPSAVRPGTKKRKNTAVTAPPVNTNSGSVRLPDDVIAEIRDVASFVKSIQHENAAVASRGSGELALSISPALAEAQRRVESVGEKVLAVVDADMRARLGSDKYENLVSDARDEVDDADKICAGLDKRHEEIDAMNAKKPPRTASAEYAEWADNMKEAIREYNKDVDIVNGRASFTYSRKLARERAASINSVLSSVRRMGGDFEVEDFSAKTTVKKLKDESLGLPADWIDLSNRAGGLYVTGSSGGGMLGSYRHVGITRLPKRVSQKAGMAYHTGAVMKLGAPPHNTVHELGHRFEHNDPQLLNLSKAFIASSNQPGATGRWVGKEMWQFRDTSNSVTKDSYTHVIYDDLGATEVVSTGLEGLIGGGAKSGKPDRRRDAHTMGLLATM